VTANRLTAAIFVDTSAFFALLNAADRNHGIANATLSQFSEERRVLLSTNFIVAETHALLLARLGYRPATEFLRAIDVSAVAIERVTSTDELAAREIIYRYDDNDFSLTDALSFAVMQRLGLTAAFTFDRDFARFGFETTP
jgi:predicted nucleic acid-binding protein